MPSTHTIPPDPYTVWLSIAIAGTIISLLIAIVGAFVVREGRRSDSKFEKLFSAIDGLGNVFTAKDAFKELQRCVNEMKKDKIGEELCEARREGVLRMKL